MAENANKEVERLKIAQNIRRNILNEEKLTHDNQEEWFFDLSLWAQKNGVKLVIKDDAVEENQRRNLQNDTVFKAQNAAVFSAIFGSLFKDDRETAYSCDSAFELVQQLKQRYQKPLSFTRHNYIGDFYGYHVKNRTIRETWTDLTGLARKVKDINKDVGKTMTDKHIFQQMIFILPSQFTQLGLIVQSKAELSTEGMIRELKELKKKQLIVKKERSESAHYGNSSQRKHSSSPRRFDRSESMHHKSTHRRKSFSSSSSFENETDVECWCCNETSHGAQYCLNRDEMRRLLKEARSHSRKSRSFRTREKKKSTLKSSKTRTSRSSSSSTSKSIRFSKSFNKKSSRAYIADSDIDADDESFVAGEESEEEAHLAVTSISQEDKAIGEQPLTESSSFDESDLPKFACFENVFAKAFNNAREVVEVREDTAVYISSTSSCHSSISQKDLNWR